jgi:phage-related minor tail protein
VKEVKKLSEKAGKDTWDKAAKQAKAYLDKMPEVKKTLDDNMKALLGSGSQNIQDVYDKVKEVADEGPNKQNSKKLQDLITKKAKEASEKGGVKWDDAWQTLQDYVKKIPGVKEVFTPLLVSG